MTRYHLFSFLLIPVLLMLTAGCDKEECDPSLDVRLSTAKQNFTIVYQTPLGQNYLDIWDNTGVVVFRNAKSNQSGIKQIEVINPGFTDGVFGPFTYTEDLVDPATGRAKAELLVGKTVSYDFYIRKDKYGVDTITVSLSLKYEGCNLVWNRLEYYRNGELQDQYTNDETAEMEFKE